MPVTAGVVAVSNNSTMTAYFTVATKMQNSAGSYCCHDLTPVVCGGIFPYNAKRY